MSTASGTPVLRSDRVSAVLARDERLVEVFVRHSPHFAKLRNRSLRRVMARLVSIEDAARIASVPVEALVRDLNAALGVASGPVRVPPPGRPVPGQDGAPAAGTGAHPVDWPVVEVDVREDLRMGREPFSRIMGAVAGLAPGDVLHLRAIFEPAPLFAVMARRGFAHESLSHARDDWSVWFWRPAAAPATAAGSQGPAPAGEPATHAPNEQWIDVRGLEPPEPMVRTLAALDSLPAGHTLVQVNVRVPMFLLPLLAERGFVFTVDETVPDRVLVRIRRADS